MAYSEIKDRRHPEFTDYETLFNLFYAAYKGGYEWMKNVGTYLNTHRMEADLDYRNRQARAFYLNYCKRVVDAYTNFIFKNGVTRSTDTQLELFFDNADGMGGSINDIMKRISCLSSVYGRVDCIVDAPYQPTGKEVSVRQVKEGENLLPYIILRSPLETLDWSLDPVGRFNWVFFRYVYYTDEDPMIVRDTSNMYRYKVITLKDWEEFDDLGNSIGSGPNDVGEVFVHRCYHKFDSGLIGTSLIADIAYINREIFNWCSLISEQIYKQTFSQLVVPDDGSYFETNYRDRGDLGDATATVAGAPALRTHDLAARIGSSYAFTFPSTSGQPPQYISPSRDQIQVIWDMIADLVIEIYRLAGLGSAESQEDSSSGRSRQRQFLAVDASLRAKAEVLEKAENEIIRLYCVRQGLEFKDEYKSVYSKDFDILSFTEELDSEIKAVTAAFSPTLNKYVLKRMASKFIDEAPIQVKNQVLSEIESGDGSILVAVSGNYVRINTDTQTTQQETAPAGTAVDNTAGEPGSKFKATPGGEAPSTTNRMTQKGESPGMSKTRRAAGIDNKGKKSKSGSSTVE